MSDDAFTRVPDGMFSEPVDLIDYGLQLGLLHPPTRDGLCVAAWDGENLRHLTAKAARKWADENDGGDYAKPLAPVTDALRTLARRIDEINTAVMFRRAGQKAMAGFAAMKTEGCA